MKLDIGCGLNMMAPYDEWTHLDAVEGYHVEIVADFGKIPLPDNSVDEIHTRDVIEHIPAWRWDEVMNEWYRILKPGGVFWGSTPNLDHSIKEYYEKRAGINQIWQWLYGDRTSYFQQHYQLFTIDYLTEFLKKYGFKNIDMTGSPGPKDCPWWIVFGANK